MRWARVAQRGVPRQKPSCCTCCSQPNRSKSPTAPEASWSASTSANAGSKGSHPVLLALLGTALPLPRTLSRRVLVAHPNGRGRRNCKGQSGAQSEGRARQHTQQRKAARTEELLHRGLLVGRGDGEQIARHALPLARRSGRLCRKPRVSKRADQSRRTRARTSASDQDNEVVISSSAYTHTTMRTRPDVREANAHSSVRCRGRHEGAPNPSWCRRDPCTRTQCSTSPNLNSRNVLGDAEQRRMRT